MSASAERIPFEVDVGRILDVLARQIYQTPLALLRENAQNAFDAVLLRRHAQGPFDARITIEVSEHEITIADNGIGMTPQDLRTHYWTAGSSGKNTPDARAAGVVGTFGIGAMANFGIADRLEIETESALTRERTRSSAARDTLSTTADCIEMMPLESTGEPGTLVRAFVSDTFIDVAEAISYIEEFVAFVTVPVLVNGTVISQKSVTEALPPPANDQESSLGRGSTRLNGLARVRVTGAGEVWVAVSELEYMDEKIAGGVVLRQGQGAIRTFRSGFGLAVTSCTSAFNLGGIADVAILQPTAGREALTTDSTQILQELVAGLDEQVALALAGTPAADQSTALMQWIRAHQRYDLCDELRIRVEPDDGRMRLADLRAASEDSTVLTYAGSDQAIIDAVSSDESQLVVIATTNPRRDCEMAYLERYCQQERITDAPTLLSEMSPDSWTIEQQAIAFRIVSILDLDYFLPVDVRLGKLSHGLPILAETDKQPLRLILDPASNAFQTMSQLYGTDFTVFGSVVKDYIRNVVFPRVADYVPSSTRQGAEAFLKSVRRTRDVFEYEFEDLGDMTHIWEEYLEGRISMGEAAHRSIRATQQSVQVFDAGATSRVEDVVPDVAETQRIIGGLLAEPGVPAPPIVRDDVDTTAKLLTVQNEPIYGYRCFIAVSDRAREERGEFFLQPHATSVVWGGQKVLFVFEHHSGEFGIYYDLQAGRAVSGESGGGPISTATIVLANKIFIPVPDAIANAFLPGPQEHKRFEVRCDLLYTDLRRMPGVEPAGAPSAD